MQKAGPEPVKFYFDRSLQPRNLLTVSDFLKFAEWGLKLTGQGLTIKEKVQKAVEYFVDKNGGAFIRINNGTLLTYKRGKDGKLIETRYAPAEWDWDITRS